MHCFLGLFSPFSDVHLQERLRLKEEYGGALCPYTAELDEKVFAPLCTHTQRMIVCSQFPGSSVHFTRFARFNIVDAFLLEWHGTSDTYRMLSNSPYKVPHSHFHISLMVHSSRKMDLREIVPSSSVQPRSASETVDHQNCARIVEIGVMVGFDQTNVLRGILWGACD